MSGVISGLVSNSNPLKGLMSMKKCSMGRRLNGKGPNGSQFIEEHSEATYLVKYDPISSFKLLSKLIFGNNKHKSHTF